MSYEPFDFEDDRKWLFWYRLKKHHPKAYEISQWMILAIAIIAIIINIVKMVNC